MVKLDLCRRSDLKWCNPRNLREMGLGNLTLVRLDLEVAAGRVYNGFLPKEAIFNENFAKKNNSLQLQLRYLYFLYRYHG